jgi:transcriptional repressor of dcmA and dcmR
MAEWLSTRQTAELLGVSEASVRRWSDHGILPVRRIGPRRERKFRTDHVERLRQAGRPTTAFPVPRQGDLQEYVLGTASFPAYTHLALFYDSDKGRLRVATPFLREGLVAGQPCLLAMRGPALESHLDSLTRTEVDVDGALRAGRLIVWDAESSSVDEALRFWEEALWTALNSQAPVIRVVGEAASQCERLGSESDQQAFEAALNLLTRRFPCLFLCQYDVRAISGPTLLSALRTHPDMMELPLRTLIC